MKENVIVRIIKSEIENYKCVRSGTIKYANNSCVQSRGELSNADIIGVYGQNGSGKTSLVESLDILKYILSSMPVPYDKYGDLISHEVDNLTKISARFFIQDENDRYNVQYSVTLKPNTRTNRIELHNEKLVYWTRGCTWKLKREISLENSCYSSECTNKTYIISAESEAVDVLKRINSHNSIQNLAAKCAHSCSSILFNLNGIKELEMTNENEAKVLHKILASMMSFGSHKLYVLNANHIEGASTHIKASVEQGCISLINSGGGVISEEHIQEYRTTFDSINSALKSFIPDMQLELHEEIYTDTNGKNQIKVSVYSCRSEVSYLSRYESEGIKHLIYFISYLIRACNDSTVTLVVDNFDNDIHEFLLGEILRFLSEEMKGQLIYTGHDLRGMEALNYKNIVCTTTNPANRYITLVGAGSHKNLRNFYIRALVIGGQEENLYDDTDLDPMGYAFRKAAKFNLLN